MGGSGRREITSAISSWFRAIRCAQAGSNAPGWAARIRSRCAACRCCSGVIWNALRGYHDDVNAGVASYHSGEWQIGMETMELRIERNAVVEIPAAAYENFRPIWHCVVL